jgi:PST family polysaccharide transporter
VLGDLLGTVIGTVAVPLFARVQADPPRLGRAVSATAGLGTLVLAPALGALALLSPELIPDVFGSQWRGAPGVAAILALRGLFTAMSSLDRAVLLNAGRAGGELRLISVITVVHCALVAVFARHGVEALAVVVLVEAVLFAPVRPYLLHRWLGVHYRCYLGAVQALVAAALAGGAALLTLRVLDVDGGAAYPTVLVVGGLAYALAVVLLARPVLRELLSALTLVRRRGVATT